MKYEGGILASLKCSLAAKLDNTAVIYGEKGRIVIPRFWAAKEAHLYTEYIDEKYIKDFLELEILEMDKINFIREYGSKKAKVLLVDYKLSR